jgi:hypothetical protein
MNAINITKNSKKRKYDELDNADLRSLKYIKDNSGKRHTVNIIEPKFSKTTKNQNNNKNISVKNKDNSRISRNFSISREYSMSVKIRNTHKNKRYYKF